jgi:hypothetical protein
MASAASSSLLAKIAEAEKNLAAAKNHSKQALKKVQQLTLECVQPM